MGHPLSFYAEVGVINCIYSIIKKQICRFELVFFAENPNQHFGFSAKIQSRESINPLEISLQNNYCPFCNSRIISSTR